MKEKELFVEYHELKDRYNEEKIKYDQLLEEKANYLYSVLPKSSNTDTDPIKGRKSDKFLNYTIKISKIDEEIMIRRNIADNLKYRLKQKLIELRESKEVLDRCYVYYFIDGKKPGKVYRLIPCSRSSAYNYREQILKKIEKK